MKKNPDDDLDGVLERPKPRRGGFRPGAGPKTIDVSKLVPVTFKLTLRQRELMKEYGPSVGGQSALIRRLIGDFFKI